MKYTDMQRMERILEYTEKLLKYIKEKMIDKKQLMDDYTIQWAVTTPLYNIGEHVYNLSDEFKTAHSEVKWHAIAGLRHRLVHDYEDTNWGLISDIVFVDLPELKKQAEMILKNSSESDS